MQTVTLGRTGLAVSVVALGAGGSSRLGRQQGRTDAEAEDLVRAALDLGVTIIDTAPVYGTEAIVGAALRGRRDGVVISTKVRPTDGPDLIEARALRASVEESLTRLQTDRIDILHLHGVRPNLYARCRDELLPEMAALRDAGKLRFLGLTEAFGIDREHAVLRQAIADGGWDVVMLGMNMVNPSAGRAVLPAAIAANVGTMCMYAVRGALARRETVLPLIEQLIEQLIASGEIDAQMLDSADPLGFLLQPGVAASLTEAAYRFCRHAPGIQVVMTGTGNVDHLKQNISDIQRPPLPPEVLRRLAEMFGTVTSATGDLEDKRPR